MKPSIVIGLVLLIASSFTVVYAQWVPASYGLPPNQGVGVFAVIGFPDQAPNLFAGQERGIWRSNNYGDSWELAVGGYRLRGLVASGTNLFTIGGLYGSYLSRSTDYGTSWTGFHFDGVMCIAVSGTNLFVSDAYSGMVRSTNNGTSWTGLPGSFRPWCMAVSGTNLFAGGMDSCGVFLSTNNGESWTAANTPCWGWRFSFVEFGTNLFAGTDAGVFLSTNNGMNWTAVNNGLPDSSGAALALSGTNLFAGTGAGVFLSTNNGTSWTAVNNGLTHTDVRALAVCGTNLFLGTGSSGVWRRPLSEMITSVDDRKALPVEFALEQNYPNPFNPTTTMRYALPQRAAVTLTVYNSLGQEVATLVQGEKEAGYHEAVFDASGLASGVYFYRLQSGGFVQSKTLVVLK